MVRSLHTMELGCQGNMAPLQMPHQHGGNNAPEKDKLSKLQASLDARARSEDQLAASSKEVGIDTPAAKVHTRDTWQQHQRLQGQISVYDVD